MERVDLEQIAISLVERDGLINLSRSGLAEAAAVPEGSLYAIMGCSFGDFLEELRAKTSDPANVTVRKARADARLRKDHILESAVEAARRGSFVALSLRDVSDVANVSPGLVLRYFESVDALKQAIMGQAVRREILSIVAEGLAVGDPIARSADIDLKQSALASLLSEI